MGRGEEFVTQFVLVHDIADLVGDIHKYSTPRVSTGLIVEVVPPFAAASGGGGGVGGVDLLVVPLNAQMRQDIDKMASYVKIHGGEGGEFDQIARRKQKDNPRFAFLFGGEYNAYYLSKLRG